MHPLCNDAWKRNQVTHISGVGIPETRISTCESEYAYQLENQLVRIHNFARRHMQISCKGMKNYYDIRTNFAELSVGDCVWFKILSQNKALA